MALDFYVAGSRSAAHGVSVPRSVKSGFVNTWRSFFGKPDGHWWSFHCWARGGHRYVVCWDACCDGKVMWCDWCLTLAPSLHALTRSESPSGAVATPKDSGGGR